jgi:hypothetical protein
MKKRVLIALTLFLTTPLLAGGAYAPSDAERARWTMSDMATWRTALEAYAKDNGAYPAAASLEELRTAVEGRYMLVAPMHDAWGNAYRYERVGHGYRIVSAGADGAFDTASWATRSMLASLDDDAVATHEGQWLARFWRLQ